MAAKLIKAEDPDASRWASRILNEGGVIVYPTETLYGLGSVATLEGAVRRVFELKLRPIGKPIPILVRDLEMMGDYVCLTQEAKSLVERFMPGALTIVLKDKGRLPQLISASSGKTAVRISGHYFVTRLFGEIDTPITSTSANLSGEGNLLSTEGLIDVLGDKVDLIVDSGKIPPSKGSTVLDLTTSPPSLIREGDIPFSEIKEYMKW